MRPIGALLLAAASLVTAAATAQPQEPAQWFQVEILIVEQAPPPAEVPPADGEVETPGAPPPANPWVFDGPAPLPANALFLPGQPRPPTSLAALMSLIETSSHRPRARLLAAETDPELDASVEVATELFRTHRLRFSPPNLEASSDATSQSASQTPRIAEPEEAADDSLISRWVEPGDDPSLEPQVDRTIPVENALVLLDDGLKLMTGDAARLRRSGYTPLAHVAWRMPLMETDPSIAVVLPSRSGNWSGTVEIERRRFLHAHLVLSLRGGDDDRWARLDQTRRMRSGELHLFDHAQVAALIRVDRWTPFEGAATAVLR